MTTANGNKNMTTDYWEVMKEINKPYYDEVMKIRAKNLSATPEAGIEAIGDLPDRLAILNHFDDIAADTVREARKG